MVPAETTVVIVEHELAGTRAWAKRTGVDLDWRPDDMELRVIIPRPGTDDSFCVVGRFDGYREVPPAWSFADAEGRVTGALGSAPAPQQTPFGACIFIKHGTPQIPVICAPFNRLAYAAEKGPHADWGGPAQWLNPRSGIFAATIGDMLAVIRRDIVATKGRMG